MPNPDRYAVSRIIKTGWPPRAKFVSAFFTIVALSGSQIVVAAADATPEHLQFTQADDGSFVFDTGVLKGVLRQSGRSTGLVPVTYSKDGSTIAAGEGLFNHYRVFTRGKRYGYGARRWPSSAELHENGSVEVVWSVTADRPFELRATYTLVAANTVDLVTVVRAAKKLEAFEVFLASYFGSTFTDSQVAASHAPVENGKVGFVSAQRELGDWLAFPRDKRAEKVIGDGRWELEPHPLKWTMMPDYTRPLAIRRDKHSGLTVIAMTQQKDCFGIFTPYGEEKHYSHYLSLFGGDIKAGESVSAHSRLVVLSNPTEADILKAANAFLK